MYKSILLLLILISASFKGFAQQLVNVRIIYVDPKQKVVALTNFLDADSNLSDWRLSFNGVDTPLSKLVAIIGTVNKCKNTQSVVLQGLPMSETKGALSLHLPNMPVDSTSLHDYLQWGDSGQAFENAAAADSLWVKGTYIKDKPAYTFKGTYGQHGYQYWQGIKSPTITLRFCKVNPNANTFTIKNAGVSNIDIGFSALCINGKCYDTIKNIPCNIIKGKYDIPKNDSLTIQLLNDTIGNHGSLALFMFPKQYYDTTFLLDFVQWGDSLQAYSGLAHQKGIWDSLQSVALDSGDSIIYTGDFSFAQSGVKYWKALSPQVLSLNDISLKDLQFFPNPVSRELTVRGIENMQYIVYDYAGKMISSGILLPNETINFSAFTPGIYHVQLYHEKAGSKTFKIIKISEN